MMHKVKAAERRSEELEQRRPKQVATSKKKEEVQAQNGQGAAARDGVWLIFARWLFSTRFLSSAWFAFGMIGRFFHFFDPLVQEYRGNFPSYLYCPMITFLSTFFYTTVIGHVHAHSLPQVLTMCTCCGVLAGAIMEEQLAQVAGTLLTTENFVYLSIACSVLSLNIHVLDYRMEGPIKKVLVSLAIVVVPSWVFVLYYLFPLSSLAIHTLHVSSFTLAVGIFDQVVCDFRNRMDMFNSIFPTEYIGCLIHCFGMIALSTYYTSWRMSVFSDSWFSFSWLVFAGAPLTVFTLVCHLIHWTCEKIFGPGPHNRAHVIKAVLASWGVVIALQLFYPNALNDVWRTPLTTARRLLTARGW